MIYLVKVNRDARVITQKFKLINRYKVYFPDIANFLSSGFFSSWQLGLMVGLVFLHLQELVPILLLKENQICYICNYREYIVIQSRCQYKGKAGKNMM